MEELNYLVQAIRENIEQWTNSDTGEEYPVIPLQLILDELEQAEGYIKLVRGE